MPIVNTNKISFYSGWIINKLVKKDEKVVTMGNYGSSVTIADLTPLNLTRAPKVLCLLSYDGGTNWYLPGGGMANAAQKAHIVFTKTEIRAVCDTSPFTMKVKYWVFSSGIESE